MSKVKSDLQIRAYKYSLRIVSFVDALPNQRSCWIMGEQVLRSGTSIGANLFEATAASSRLEFKKYHEISLKSANETKYWLGLLRDSGKAKKIAVEPLLTEAIELANMIASGILKLKGKKDF